MLPRCGLYHLGVELSAAYVAHGEPNTEMIEYFFFVADKMFTHFFRKNVLLLCYDLMTVNSSMYK